MQFLIVKRFNKAARSCVPILDKGMWDMWD